MHCVRHRSVSIRQMDSINNFTKVSSKWLYIGNGKEVYQSCNKCNCIQQMLKQNDFLLVLTISRRCSHILCFKSGTILTLQMFSIYFLLAISRNIHRSPFLTPSALSVKAGFPPYITTATIFERNSSPLSVQMYQINIT